MTGALYRLGRNAARHPFVTMLAWILIAVIVWTAATAFGESGTSEDDMDLPGTEHQKALDILKAEFHDTTTGSGRVVFQTSVGTLDDARHRGAIEVAMARVERLPHVSDAMDPLLSGDKTIGLSQITYDVGGDDLSDSTLDQLERALAPATESGIRTEFAGDIVGTSGQPDGQEAIGLAAAVVILFVALGSLLAMALPIGMAFAALGVGLGLLGVMSAFLNVPEATTTLAAMIGLGVGIDYCLFVLTRYRQNLVHGLDPVEAAGRANATAGQAVVFAGLTVVVAICGLALSGLPAMAAMGYGTAVVVACSVLSAITLLPAFLGLAGDRVNGVRRATREKKARHHERPAEETVSGRWAAHVSARPWRYSLISLAVLLALAAPILSMRIGFDDDGDKPRAMTQRQAYDLTSTGFGPGFNGTLLLTMQLREGDVGPQARQLETALWTVDGVDKVAPAEISDDGRSALITLVPDSGPSDVATQTLVDEIRSGVIPSVTDGSDTVAYVGGETAALIDVSEKVTARLPTFIVAVVGLSFILLLVLFRSVLVPLKAAIMNLLSIGAAYGFVVAVFQWGWGASWIGVDDSIPVNPFVPMMMFAILFGLSMDYEVFLLSRVREEWVRTGDSQESVVRGLAATARVITSAALIMISVFLAFVTNVDPLVKIFGLGLAVAVFLDATLVRMVLVPATMALLGDRNWWLPGWLDRMLPHLDIEGSDIEGPDIEGPDIEGPDTEGPDTEGPDTEDDLREPELV